MASFRCTSRREANSIHAVIATTRKESLRARVEGRPCVRMARGGVALIGWGGMAHASIISLDGWFSRLGCELAHRV